MSRFYTEVSLNDAEEGILNLSDWQAGWFTPPLQYLKAHHLPTMTGANTLPPAGRFATMQDMTGQDFATQPQPYSWQAALPASFKSINNPIDPIMKSSMLVSPLTAAAVALTAFYLFLPQRI
jgi:hypothetical protein